MAELLILIPTVAAIAMLFFAPPQRVLLRIYLPCLMLVPLYMQFQIRGVNIDSASLVAMVLAIAGLATQFRTLRFTLLDAVILGLAFSAFYADAYHGRANIGGIELIQTLLNAVFPYVIGRTLIEQTDNRVRFAKVLVICLVGMAIFSVWEFRMTQNLFQEVAEAVLGHATTLVRQRRWGFARVAGPYAFAITGGIVFTFGVILQIWLQGTKRWKYSEMRRQVNPRSRPVLITLAVVAGLFMTQSRGPWIGCGLGTILAVIGLAKDRRRALILGLSLFVVSSAVTYVILDQYTDKSAEARNDQDRQNATYRRELWDTYWPRVQEGGLWGNGSPIQLSNDVFGYDKSQASIDDEFLRISVAQGYFGGVLLILAFALCLYRLIVNCSRLKQRDDAAFAFCMLGLVVGSTFSLTTVYLGAPALQLMYLFFGWSESMRATPAAAGAPVVRVQEQPAFERVFV